jgi:hypothetical protein
MMRPAIVARRLTRSERAKLCKWLRRVNQRVREGNRHKHDDYLVRGDEDLAEAIVDYSSVAVCGWTWPGEKRLAQTLNETDRNIRKRAARLRAAKLLIALPPSEGWPSKRYIPVLDSQPLFEVALTSDQVRDAVAALGRDGGGVSGTPVPPQNAAETGTPVPAEEVRTFRHGWNAGSAKSSRKNPQERYPPTPYPTPKGTPPNPQGEEETLDLELEEARSAARAEPAPTSGSTTESTERPEPPDGCPREDEPEVRVEPDRAEQAPAPVLEFGFARLMRDYPHPTGGHGIDHRAYCPHARAAWGKLAISQKQDAARAASNAPGKEWLGHWLDGGRETGKFQIVEQRAGVPRVWVCRGTPQWAAWVDYCRTNRRPLLETDRLVNGDRQTGWMFESEWPPGLTNAERVGGGNE